MLNADEPLATAVLRTVIEFQPPEPGVEYLSFHTACIQAWKNERFGPEVVLQSILDGRISIAIHKNERGRLRIVLSADDFGVMMGDCEIPTRIVSNQLTSRRKRGS